MKTLLRLPSEMSKKPLIAEIILETEARINIDRANVGAVGGETVLDVPDDKYENVVAFFKSKGVETVLLTKPILLDEDKCLHCGACVSICPTEVFGLEDDWHLGLDAVKCIQCSACITACLFGALSLSEDNLE